MDGFQSPPKTPEDDAKSAQEDQMRRDLMTTMLDTAARERLTRISLVSPERSKQIETILVRMAQSGQIRNKITEDQLIDLLDQMEPARGQFSQKSTIVYQRRKGLDDDLDI